MPFFTPVFTVEPKTTITLPTDRHSMNSKAIKPHNGMSSSFDLTLKIVHCFHLSIQVESSGRVSKRWVGISSLSPFIHACRHLEQLEKLLNMVPGIDYLFRWLHMRCVFWSPKLWDSLPGNRGLGVAVVVPDNSECLHLFGSERLTCISSERRE